MSAALAHLGRASFTGALWNAATFGLSKIVVLVTTVILARLLDPADFGLLGIGLVVIGYLDFINDFGVSAAVVQHEGEAEETASTAFWLNMALGFTLGVVGFFGAPYLADFFSEPRATSVIRVLSLSFPLTSIGSIHDARLRRDLRFGRRVVPEFLKGVAKGVVSITMALMGYGVWSLVWGQLAGTAVAAVCYWAVFPWVPSIRFSRRTSRELLGFGSQLTMVGLLGGLHKNFDYLVVGRQLGTKLLGLYTLAFRLPQLLVESVVDIAGQVAFPAFSRVRTDPVRVRKGLQRMLGMIGLIIMPLGLGLALTADPFVRVFYGSRWTAAIPVMRVLSIYILVQSLSKTCGDVYKAMGRPGILNKLAIIKLAVTIPLLVIAVPHGIVAVAVAQLIAAAILTVWRLVLAARVVDVPIRDVLTPFVPSLRGGAIMTVACLAAIAVTNELGSLAAMIVIVAVGAISYFGTLWVFDRALISDYRRMVRPARAAVDQSASEHA